MPIAPLGAFGETAAFQLANVSESPCEPGPTSAIGYHGRVSATYTITCSSRSYSSMAFPFLWMPTPTFVVELL